MKHEVCVREELFDMEVICGEPVQVGEMIRRMNMWAEFEG
jgi:hypothetical protein